MGTMSDCCLVAERIDFGIDSALLSARLCSVLCTGVCAAAAFDRCVSLHQLRRWRRACVGSARLGSGRLSCVRSNATIAISDNSFLWIQRRMVGS